MYDNRHQNTTKLLPKTSTLHRNEVVFEIYHLGGSRSLHLPSHLAISSDNVTFSFQAKIRVLSSTLTFPFSIASAECSVANYAKICFWLKCGCFYVVNRQCIEWYTMSASAVYGSLYKYDVWLLPLRYETSPNSFRSFSWSAHFVAPVRT
jgi:hypothetical protein